MFRLTHIVCLDCSANQQSIMIMMAWVAADRFSGPKVASHKLAEALFLLLLLRLGNGRPLATKDQRGIAEQLGNPEHLSLTEPQSHRDCRPCCRDPGMAPRYLPTYLPDSVNSPEHMNNTDRWMYTQHTRAGGTDHPFHGTGTNPLYTSWTFDSRIGHRIGSMGRHNRLCTLNTSRSASIYEP